MIIRNLQLQAFGKFHNKTVSLKQGMNIIEGRNEAGKSTIHAFIRAVLFGIDKEKDDKRYTKYSPWMDIGSYKGAIVFEENGIALSLERDFKKGTLSLLVNDGEKVFEGEEAEKEVFKILGGLTDTGFANTVSIGQMKGTTDDTIAEELRNNLDNLSRARSMALSFKDAEDALRKMRAELEYDLEKIGDAKSSAAEPENADDFEKALDECWDAYREYEDAEAEKEKVYGIYEEKRNEFLSSKERIEKEQDDITGQLGAIDSSGGAGKKLLESKKERIEKLKNAGKDPVKAFKPAIGILMTFIFLFLAGAAASTIIYAFADRLSWLLIIAASLAGAAIVFAIICTVLENKYEKNKSYYRSLLDRQSRTDEYKRKEKDLANEKNELFAKMSEEHDGKLMQATRRAEETRKRYDDAMAAMSSVTDRMDEAKRREYSEMETKLKYDRTKELLDAVDLAWEHMYIAGDLSVKSFGADLLVKTGEIIGCITGGKYTGLSRDAQGNLFLYESGRNTSIESVSRGTMEQVYLALRIAASELLSPSVDLPFILDDTFAYYDEERMKNALAYLKNCKHQVILLTCHSRESRILKEI